jgi:hypothetical protein
MSNDARPSGDAIFHGARQRIDAICLRFEEAWEAGQRPLIEEYLQEIADELRPPLLRQLLTVEVVRRRGLGETPLAGDYRGRFPGCSVWLSELLPVEASQPAALPASESSRGTGGRNQGRADTTPEQPQADAGPKPTVPGYEILGVIVKGGMGVVYKARDVQLKRLVAIKVIRADLSGDAPQLARFRTEAEAIARLRHENIVRIHAFGEHRGQPYLVLEWVEGGSLDRYQNGEPLSPRHAAELVLKLAQAVEHSHQYLIIHRDLKPANVLLTHEAEPKITDFGLARDLDGTRLTQSGAVMGTPSYMAPEQAAGDVDLIGPATDIYALGAVLFEALTGKAPFQGRNMLEILQRVQTLPAPSPRALNPDVPPSLETICLTCLRKNPRDRYSSAASLAADLRSFLRSRPIKGSTDPARPRAATPDAVPRRNPIGLAKVHLRAFVAAYFCLLSVAAFQGGVKSRDEALALISPAFAAVLVPLMLARARLLPAAVGAAVGVVLTLLANVLLLLGLVALGALEWPGLGRYYEGGGWRVLYVGSLVVGLAAGVLCAGGWPRSVVLPGLLAAAGLCGLLTPDEGKWLVLSTAVALWLGGVGRAAAAYFGGLPASGVAGAFNGMLIALPVVPLAYVLGIFGAEIKPTLLNGSLVVIAIFGPVVGAIRAARMSGFIRRMLEERGFAHLDVGDMP